MTTQEPEWGVGDKVKMQKDGSERVVMIYTTFPDQAEAERLGGALVERGLVACANIVPGMVSIYVWEGQVQHGAEVVMLLKTRASLADRVVAEIEAGHSYDTPAVLVIEPVGGSAAFVAWIMQQTAAAGVAAEAVAVGFGRGDNDAG